MLITMLSDNEIKWQYEEDESNPGVLNRVLGGDEFDFDDEYEETNDSPLPYLIMKYGICKSV